MSYLDIYKARVEHLGATPQQRAFNSGILEFRRYLKYNQHAVSGLRNERTGDVITGVILTDKEDENRVSQILLVELGIDIVLGDLIYWNDEPWLVYRSTTSSYQPHQKFYMVKCNYYIGWVNKEGKIQNSWIYLLGSKDSKIKDNFRTWNNLITPQPNKYINIILPYVHMDLGTEIIIIDETWYLVDFDKNSVPGIIFMSFTETNFNEQRDGEVGGQMIANKDTIATWKIEIPSHRHVKPGERFKVETYSITKNGQKIEAEPRIAINKGSNLTMDEEGYIIAGISGKGSITLYYENTNATQSIIIDKEAKEALIITGDGKIKVSKTAIYEVSSELPITFSLEDEDKLASLEPLDSNRCKIKTNISGKTGSIVLKATDGAQMVKKVIEIIPLWQVI